MAPSRDRRKCSTTQCECPGLELLQDTDQSNQPGEHARHRLPALEGSKEFLSTEAIILERPDVLSPRPNPERTENGNRSIVVYRPPSPAMLNDPLYVSRLSGQLDPFIQLAGTTTPRERNLLHYCKLCVSH